MARKTTDTTQPAEATVTEAFLLGVADLIYATFGNPAAAPAPVVEEEAPAPVEAPVEEPEEDDEPAEEPEIEPETADEVDADEDEDLEAERAELEKLSLAALRKKLVDLGYDPEEVKAEKDKATLVEAILSDEDEDDEDDDLDDEDVEDEGDEDGDYTAEDLDEMSLAELKEIAAEMELEIAKGARSATYKKAILEAQEIAEDEDADEDEDDAEEADEEELEKLTLPELRKVAKETYGLTAREIKGLDKDGILDLIFEDEDEEEDD